MYPADTLNTNVKDNINEKVIAALPCKGIRFVRAGKRLNSALGGIFCIGGLTMLYVSRWPSFAIFPWFFMAVAAIILAMAALYYGHQRSWGMVVILASGLLFRLAFLPWPEDSDLNRYVWEGQIQQAGQNPYLVAPEQRETEAFRTAYWQGVNHKEFPAVYGPLAQLVFRTVANGTNPILTLKLLFLMADCAVLALLLVTLTKYRLPLRLGWLYALHPLPALVLVGEGHLEPLLILPLFAGLLAIERQKFAIGVVLLGLAVAIKTSVIIIVPFALRHVPRRYWLLVFLPLSLWLCYGTGFFTHFETLMRFSHTAPFNSLFFFVGDFFFHAAPSHAPSIALFLVAAFIVWSLDMQPLRSVLLVYGLFLCCSPIAHPWYFAVLLPIAILFGSIPWILLCTSTVFLLAVSLDYQFSGSWHVPAWLILLEFAPFFIGYSLTIRRRSSLAPAFFPPPTFLSVLIPVFNEEGNIKECLESIVFPNDLSSEILVIDGGSSDKTMQLAASDPRVRTLAAAPGRGQQIAAGYRQAKGDLLVIVHADSRLTPQTLTDITLYCRTHLHTAGGACTARYRHPAIRFRITELLNDLRLQLTGIAFGDQVQFFRRQAIEPNDFPDFRLMEDVELSLVTGRKGAQAQIKTTVYASHRRWEKVGYQRNTLQVITLFSAYMFLRSLGFIRDKGAFFYRLYYGAKKQH